MAKRKQSVPYASATSGARAKEEIEKRLLAFGCRRFDFAEDMDRGVVLLAFAHRGRPVALDVSYKGYAQMWLRANPWTPRKRVSKQEWEDRALAKGRIAVWSIVRDWIKAELTAVECGIVSAEKLFLPWTLTNDGKPLAVVAVERGLLPPPTKE